MEKHLIIDAIKRVAAASGGAAPGWRKLESEAGIRYHDWYGKYWSKWSDALLEAGLAANAMNSAYDSNELLKRLAELTRQLGHFPVNGEILLAARSDSTLPNAKTFGRLGSKAARIRMLADFCRNTAGFEDVLSVLPDAPEAEIDVESEPAVLAEGFVYLIRFGRYYKIGRTNEIGRRGREIALELPEETRLIHSMRTDDPSGIEAYWHRRFAAKRRNGEWFELNAADVRAFKKRRYM